MKKTYWVVVDIGDENGPQSQVFDSRPVKDGARWLDKDGKAGRWQEDEDDYIIFEDLDYDTPIKVTLEEEP